MTVDRGVVRRAAQLVALADGLHGDGLDHADKNLVRPVYWPGLTPEEAEEEWNALRRWVEQLRARFPNAIRPPECWWRHNDLVEVLAALRDFERAAYAATSPATAPVEWQRALRDMEIRVEMWIKRFSCSVAGRGHEAADRSDVPPVGWEEFVEQDIRRRHQQATPAVLDERRNSSTDA